MKDWPLGAKVAVLVLVLIVIVPFTLRVLNAIVTLVFAALILGVGYTLLTRKR